MHNQLKTYFGYDTFRLHQEEIITSVLAGRDALVLMPTGSGKSLCYQLPAVLHDGMTIVISPLIALMKDQVDSLVASGIEAACLNSTMSVDERREIEREARNGALDILYLAPERLAMPAFQEFLKGLNVRLIAIDEAHCISEWGHDFRPDYASLSSLRVLFRGVPIIALTATATEQVRADILKQLEMPGAGVFVSSFDRANLHYTILQKQGAFVQLQRLLESCKGESVIIYCFSRKETEDLAADLCQSGFSAAAYHAGLDHGTRRRTQEQFIRDEVPIIVATIAFGMGIDKPDVRLVVHMNIPRSMEAYYQETGRAGRDGLPSRCVMFYSFGDRRKHEYFIDQMGNEKERALARTKLGQVTDYCDDEACRRKFLLGYFGETYEQDGCEACDNCLAPAEELHDATLVSQKILSAVLKTGEMFGSGYVVDVLRGSRAARIGENRHDDLSVHGIARDVSKIELSEFFRFLTRKGYLVKASGTYPTLSLSQKGVQALKSRESIMLPKPEPAPASIRAAKEGDLAYDAALFEKLRALRKEIASEQGVPPYIIFGDRTLQEMAHYLPQDEEAIGELFGVGERKREAFGELFVGVIAQFAGENDLEARAVPLRDRPRRASRTSRSGSTYQETKILIDQKRSLSEIVKERGVTEGTVVAHIEKLLAAGESIDISHLAPTSDRLDEIKAAFIKTKTDFLGPVRKILGEDYSYDEIRLARLFL